MQFIDTLTNIVTFINDNILWGIPMVLIILGVGIFMTIRTRALQVRKFDDSLKSTIVPTVRDIFKGKKRKKKSGEKSVSQFEAFSAAISGTVGTGNIVGVGVFFLEMANAAAHHNQLQCFIFGDFGIFRICGNMFKMNRLLGTDCTAVHTLQAASVMVRHGSVIGHGNMVGRADGCTLSAFDTAIIKCNLRSHLITSFVCIIQKGNRTINF